MKEYIEKETLDSELYNRFHDEDEPSNITDVRLGEVRNFVRAFPTADVVEREKIKEAREKIWKNVYEYSGTGDEVLEAYKKGFQYSLKIIDELIESEEK